MVKAVTSRDRRRPYRHFADRDELLAAAALRASDALAAALAVETSQAVAPADRLATAARAYVRFAADNPAHRGSSGTSAGDRTRLGASVQRQRCDPNLTSGSGA